MPYTYTLTSILPATPQEIYDAWLDSVAHSAMTGADAAMSDELGAEVSAWNGYITGRNLELVAGERIVQSWRTSKFGDEHEDSIVTLTLEGTDEGTVLTLVHSNVPDEQKNYQQGGWESNYFEPMKAYFAAQDDAAGEEPPKPARNRPRKVAAKPVAKRTAGNKASKARVHASPARKKKTKRAAAPKKRRRKVAGKKSLKRSVAKSKSRRKARSHR
jgi:uncharacterized protein YndB with AHSA1/START domain